MAYTGTSGKAGNRAFKLSNNFSSMKKNFARCTGLWLAEGDTETGSEITFTNNCFDLVEIFYGFLEGFAENQNLRLYVYRPSEDAKYQSLENVSSNFYVDDRATQTYYILRAASVKMVDKWKRKVEKIKSDPENYKYILQGFFAGEGSIYEGSRNSRSLRISQGEKNSFLEKMLNYFSIDYRFRSEERSYVVTKKRNWDKFAELEICCLHPRKRKKFNKIHNNFKEDHYEKGRLKEEVFELLTEPCRTKELAKLFDRSPARLCDVLRELKREGKVEDYKAGNTSYWIKKDRDAVIISEVKKNYLELLKGNPLKVGKIADYFDVCKNSAYKNLNRLEELGLIKKEDHKWRTIKTEKEVIVL